MAERDGPFSLLDGDLLDGIRQLELFSRFRVEGTLHGQNPSPYKGFTADFLQHRQYFAGDNLKYVDWRVYGRTERLFVREYEELTNARIAVILDVSGSMAHRGAAAMTKHEFAVRNAALMLFLAHLHRDAFSLCTFRTGRAGQVGFGGGRAHLHRTFAALLGARPEGGTDFDRGLDESTAAIRRRGLTVVLSDFMDEPETIARRLARLRFQGGDVIAMQVYDPGERELDFNAITRFHDPEGPEILVVDPQIIQQAYREVFDAHVVGLKEACQRHGFMHVALPVGADYAVPILEFIHWRMERFS